MKRVIILLAVILFSGAGGYLLASQPGPVVAKPGDFKWLNPFVNTINLRTISKSGYAKTKNQLEELIDAWKSEGKIDRGSIFYRDLANGPYFSIEENDLFIPASLLKVPLMITYLRLADEDPSVLNTKLIAENFEDDFDQSFAPSERIERGQSYTIDDLLRRLIAHSDNRAWDILVNHLTEISPNNSLLFDTYHDLGILEPSDPTAAIITAETYAFMFRVLYNASFLSIENSDKALDYLSQSTFTQGLRQGVPERVPIAHKFGERNLEDSFQLHDCGIVYFPRNPYAICVMTSGPNAQMLSEFIGAVSDIVYEEVESRKLD